MIFNADFHVHSCLSPCADLTMTPNEIGARLKKAKVNWVSITDHNSCGNLPVFEKVLKKYDVALLAGIEVQTREEVHVLVYFKNVEMAQSFSKEVEKHLPHFRNDPERFGYQLFVNETDKFIGMEDKILSASINLSIKELWSLSRKYDVLFVYAHADRKFGVIKQLGFIPQNPPFDAIEIVGKEIKGVKKPILKSSDAHFLDQIRKPFIKVKANNPTFDELKKALKRKEVWLL